jgi:hypothetical protein
MSGPTSRILPGPAAAPSAAAARPARRAPAASRRDVVGQHRQCGPVFGVAQQGARHPAPAPTGVVIYEKADPSRGTTDPATELVDQR